MPRFHGSEFSVKDIFTEFTDNHNWDSYLYFHRKVVRQVEKKEVEKMMSCKGPDRGWLSSKMFDVHHRHAVMTLPDRLRPVLNEHQIEFMRFT